MRDAVVLGLIRARLRAMVTAIARAPARLVPGSGASVRTQLLGLFATAAFLIGVLVGVNAFNDFRDARSTALAQLGHDASVQSKQLETYYEHGFARTMRSLTEQPGLRSNSARRCGASLQALHRLAPGAELAVIRPDESVVCSAGHLSLINRSGWIRSAFLSGTSYGTVGLDVVTGVPETWYGVTFEGDDGDRLLTFVSPSYQQLLEPTPGNDVALMLVDEPSGLVIDHAGTGAFHNAAPIADPALRVPGSGLSVAGPDGVDRIYTSVPVAGTEWVAVAGVTRSAVYAYAYQDLHRNLTLGGIVLVALFGLGLVVYRRIARPTRRLRAAIETLASADVGKSPNGHVPEEGPRELAELGHAFNEMVDARVHSEARLASLVRHASDLVFVVDGNGTITYATPSVEALLRTPAERVVGRKLVEFVAASQRAQLQTSFSRWLAKDRRAPMQLDFRLQAGDVCREVEAHVQDLVDDPALRGLVITCHDITDRKRAQAELEHAAMHDMLTGLPNRALVLDRLTQVLARVGRTGTHAAVLFLDLDRFKLINDSSGHSVGDELIVQVAKRLTSVTRPGDTLGRFGGDEFVVVCEGLDRPDDAQRVAARLLDALQLPFRLADQDVFVTASVGIAPALPGDDPGDVLRDADSALYRAKERGRAGYAVFDDEMRAKVRNRLEVSNRLRQAINGDGLYLDYQPIVAIDSLRVVGAEALLRWRSETGLVRPDEFIPVAEETGMIVPIGEWVIREACRQMARWSMSAEVPHAHVSVNVSARQLAQPGFVHAVARALEDSGVPPGALTLEVTESVLMRDPEASAATMAVLRSFGVSMAIDDFGTGYSSLGYLEKLPIDELKIDRSFVAVLGERDRTSAIVESVVDLGHAVGLSVVAEGVEQQSQVELLADMACDFAQGFHFARPMPAEAVLPLLLHGLAADHAALADRVPTQRAADSSDTAAHPRPS